MTETRVAYTVSNFASAGGAERSDPHPSNTDSENETPAELRETPGEVPPEPRGGWFHRHGAAPAVAASIKALIGRIGSKIDTLLTVELKSFGGDKRAGKDPDFPRFLLPPRLSRSAGGALADPEPRLSHEAGWSIVATASLLILVAGWFIGVEGAGPNRTAAAVDSRDTKRATLVLPRADLDARTAAGLGETEYRVASRQYVRYLRVGKGDTFIGLLSRAGANREEARSAVASLAGIFEPRKLRPGRRIAVLFGLQENRHNAFVGMRFDSSFDRVVAVQRQADGRFIATELRKRISTEMVRGDGVIEDSLFQAGLRARVPAAAMIRLIHLFSFDVDFQRDIRPGDRFEIMYMRQRAQDGDVVRNGEVVYAALTLRGVTQRLYRYTAPSGRTDYFDDKGRGLKKALMRTPIDGARLSSNYGRRRHPILGYTRMHAGVDFAAPRGTPIFAAGDGTVNYIGRRGGYGNYIRIRHTRNYQTAYAHMNRFAKGLSRGDRVRQGQVIGYVGSTGRSTGPHLHYEVLHNGGHINPMKLRLPPNQHLEGEDLERFLTYRDKMDARYAELEETGGAQVIAASSEKDLSICVNGRRLDPTDGRPCPADGATTTRTAATSLGE